MRWSLFLPISKRHCAAGWKPSCYLHSPKKYYSKKKLPEDATEYHKRSPPWNVMFFGTDNFSVRSLKALHREQRTRGLIRKLDVVSVSLKKSTPAVRQYCQKEGLKVIDWPVTVPQGVYDIGIVVSFGHLIPASVISAFPMFDVGHVVSKVVVPVEWNTKCKSLQNIWQKLELRSYSHSSPISWSISRKLTLSPQKVLLKLRRLTRASRAQWGEWSCSDVQAHFRALDDYMPLWSLWQGKPAKLRGMVMQQEWSTKSNDAKTSIDLHAGKDRSDKKNGTSKLVTDYVENVKNSCVVADSPRNSVYDSLDNHSQKMNEREVPGSVVYDRKARTIRVCCRDGWVAFQHIVLKGHKPMTAQDFYNGFISKVPKDSHRFT